MTKLEVTGKLIVINPTQQVSEKFAKREFVIETEDQYPQKVMFQLTQDKCDYMENFKVGQKVVVGFNLRGREWTSPQGDVKYFNTLEAWKVLKDGAQQAQPAPQQTQPSILDEEEDDLQF